MVRLSSYDNLSYRPGRSRFWQALWFFLGLPLLRCALIPSSSFRAALLRLFGAQIGRGAVIKPGLRVKYPWLFTAGDHCWLGEDAWIDNLAPVSLGANVCISQGAYLCTGNHDWRDPAFRLSVLPIHLRGGFLGGRPCHCGTRRIAWGLGRCRDGQRRPPRHTGRRDPRG